MATTRPRRLSTASNAAETEASSAVDAPASGKRLKIVSNKKEEDIRKSVDEELGKPIQTVDDEERIRKALAKQGILSLTEAMRSFDLAAKLLKEFPKEIKYWQLLGDVAKLKEIGGRKLSGACERNLTEALSVVCAHAGSLPSEISETCKAVWQILSDSLGFRPRLEALRDMLTSSNSHDAFLILLREFKQAAEADAARKAFEIVCNEHILSILLQLSASKDLPRSELAEEIIFNCLFRSDDDDEICAACINPRLEYDKQNKKATNQNNWRASFWKVLDDCIRKESIPASSALGFLCVQHRRKHRSTTTVFWFEMLFRLLQVEGSAEFFSAACEDLLKQGLSWYEPTLAQDESTLRQWVEKVVHEKPREGVALVKVIKSALTLDYRAVEPFFGRLVKGDCFIDRADRSSRIAMVLATLQAFAETRRTPQWIRFMQDVKANDWFEHDDIRNLDSFREQTVAIFRTKVTEHQAAQIWKSFVDDVNEHTGNDDEVLLCALEAFVFTVRCGSGAGEISATAREEMLKVTLDNTEKARVLARDRLLRAFSGKRLESFAANLTLLRLYHSATLLHRLCGQDKQADATRQNEMVSLADGFRAATGSLPRQIKTEMAVCCLDCFVPSLMNESPKARIVNWSAEVLFEAGEAALLLRSLSSSSLDWVHLLSEDNCINIWTKIVIDREDAFVQLLSKAFFYEIAPLQSSFLGFVDNLMLLGDDDMQTKQKRMNDILRLASQFPSGYLTPKLTKKLIVKRCFGQSDVADPTVLCEGLLQASSPSVKLVRKAFNDSVDNLLGFCDKLPRRNVADDERISGLFRAFATETKIVENLSELAALIIQRGGYSARALQGLMLGTAERVLTDRDEPGVVDVGRRVLEIALREGAEAAGTTINFTAAGSILDLARALAQATSTTKIAIELPLKLNVGELLHAAAMTLSSSLTQDSRTQDAESFVLRCCRTFHLFDPELDSSAMNALLALSVLMNSVGKFKSSGCLESVLLHCQPQQVATLLDSAMADAWLDDDQSRQIAARTLRTFLEFRVRKTYEMVVLRRASPLLVALARLCQSGTNDDAWLAMIAFVNSDVLRESMTSKDVAVVLTATAASNHVLKARFLQLLSELHPKAVSKHVSAAFTAAIASLERHLLFSGDSKRDMVGDALELVRLCETLKDNPSVFRHHAVPLLADHITLCYVRGTPSESLRRPLELIAFYLLDLCGDHELQQLHAALGGGAGGARREVLKRLVEDHQRTHVFKGKI